MIVEREGEIGRKVMSSMGNGRWYGQKKEKGDEATRRKSIGRWKKEECGRVVGGLNATHGERIGKGIGRERKGSNNKKDSYKT